jgi:AmmeMemoRadiSam system protein A
MKINLTKDEEKFLIYTVKKSIADYLKINANLKEPTINKTQIDNEKYGAFVTIHINEDLRGCIGYIQGIKPFLQQIKDLAIQSAFHDPRFTPLTKEEFPLIKVEVTILSPFEKIENFYDFQLGKEGLYLKYKYYSGLFLPQVATEQGWSKEEFLKNLTYKAGLYPEILQKKETEIYKFSGYIISEE